MEAGGKEFEEETLQTAFKKLRVDAESLPAAVSATEAASPRSASRACLDGAKPKHVCQKDIWHGCTRKTSRAASRTQRRRRSKSPILQPPKFTYCSSATASALSSPNGSIKPQLLASLEPAEPCPSLDVKSLSSMAQKEPSSLHAQSHISALVFGASAAYGTSPGVSASSSQEPIPAITVTGDGHTRKDVESRAERSACDGESGAPLAQAHVSDFKALSELNKASSAQCSCSLKKCLDTPEGNDETNNPDLQCCLSSNHASWNNEQVYSFTGLRNVITECERATLSPEDSQRTVGTNSNLSPTSASGSPRSCSEQARAYVDDITIEDLSGYLEYYLYIPKKMSHMAEMMYT